MNFNPRSHERSDTNAAGTAILPLDFNPRSHERSDVKEFSHSMILSISIHAPTRGATATSLMYRQKLTKFQSTLPREERLMVAILNQKILVFQSTLPREERPDILYILLLKLRFQSTLPREERQLPQVPYMGKDKFQSTLPREERLSALYLSVSVQSISIHAPTRGATAGPFLMHKIKEFQSTLPREERQQYCTKNLFIFIQYRQ